MLQFQLSLGHCHQKHEEWVINFAKDLKKEGVEVVIDEWHNPPGTDLSVFVEKIHSCRFVCAIGTPSYLKKYASVEKKSIVASEIELINQRILEGTKETSFPPLLRKLTYLDFRKQDNYYAMLLDLFITICEIPFDKPEIMVLRESFVESN